jgi:hypothetical protein
MKNPSNIIILSLDYVQYPSHLNSILIEVFTIIKGKDYVQYPSLMESPPHTHTFKDFCLFYKGKRHDVED